MLRSHTSINVLAVRIHSSPIQSTTLPRRAFPLLPSEDTCDGRLFSYCWDRKSTCRICRRPFDNSTSWILDQERCSRKICPKKRFLRNQMRSWCGGMKWRSTGYEKRQRMRAVVGVLRTDKKNRKITSRCTLERNINGRRCRHRVPENPIIFVLMKKNNKNKKRIKKFGRIPGEEACPNDPPLVRLIDLRSEEVFLPDRLLLPDQDTESRPVQQCREEYP